MVAAFLHAFMIKIYSFRKVTAKAAFCFEICLYHLDTASFTWQSKAGLLGGTEKQSSHLQSLGLVITFMIRHRLVQVHV